MTASGELARLHVVTDDAVLADPGFERSASSLLDALGAGLALHLRGHATPVRRLHALARALAGPADRHGATLLVADRVDVALAVPRVGVRLGGLSLPVAAARALLPDRQLAYSAHGTADAEAAEAEGADLVVLGTIWATASHPGRKGAGTALIAEAVPRLRVPVIAIGGVTPARVADAVAAGATGVAVLRGIWSAPDPVAAATDYRDRLDRAASS